MDVHWQVQEAKQRFSELVRRAESEGPQYVTKHGKDVVVVVEIGEFHRLTGRTRNFKQYVESAPRIDDVDWESGRTVEYTHRDAYVDELFGVPGPGSSQ